MGYAIAAAALEAGHEVVLVSGPVSIQPPSGLDLIRVTTAQEMGDAIDARLGDIDMLVMAAAVADYRPAAISAQKIKKGEDILRLELVRTRDILSSLPACRKFSVIGFAAETENVAINAKKKLAAKRCDLVVANDVSRADIGFDGDENEVTFFFADGTRREILRAPKKEIARELVKVFAILRKSVDKTSSDD